MIIIINYFFSMDHIKEPSSPSFVANYTFTKIGKGRWVAYINNQTNNSFPIIRNTHFFEGAMQEFTNEIKSLGDFNCGFIEKYNRSYSRMAFHSDCDVDINPSSLIGIMSISDSHDAPTRSIEIVEKNNLSGASQIIELRHGELFTFSYEFNKTHLHRIIGDAPWCGITLYKSINCDCTSLPIYTESEKKEFCKMQKMHNYSLGGK